MVVIYIFLELAKPPSLKEDQDSDDDYEEELDRIRDPNADVMFLVKTGRSMFKSKRHLKGENYDMESRWVDNMEEDDEKSIYTIDESSE